MKIEIRTPGGYFKGDAATARIFLGALGDTTVSVVSQHMTLATGADLALLILERQGDAI